jgi:hypothetical protein
MKDLQFTPMFPAEDGNGWIDPDGKRWQELNPKQKKFVREYVKGQNATEAAVKAGYTKNRNAAKRQGSVLLNHKKSRPRSESRFPWRPISPPFMTCARRRGTKAKSTRLLLRRSIEGRQVDSTLIDGRY